MSLSGKALGYKIIVANTISIFLFVLAFSGSSDYSATYSASIPEAVDNSSPKYDPGGFAVTGWSPPTTGISAIDWLLAFYYLFSYGIAIWLIANPLGG